MGHLSLKNLARLEDIVDGIEEAKEYCTYVPYVRGRIRERPHWGELQTGTYSGDVVHADICGPFRVTGYRGELY